jgi:glycine dehydrogenase subunit 1
MSVYTPATAADRARMLGRIGAPDIEALFSDIPEEIRLKGELKLAGPMSEYELGKELRVLAASTRPASVRPCFLGAGAYDRLIPAAIKHLTGRSEFLTAYTPYQPEISQGTLQAIFEFQTMIASLTGMDVANASMYDGPSACAEAVVMAARHTRRSRVLVSGTVHPEARAVVDTYARFNGFEVVTVPSKNGVTDAAALAGLMTDAVAAVVVQSPNFFGLTEDVTAAAEAAHGAGALAISYTADALALAVLKSPGESGADIAVGEGQSFGIPMYYGGPWLGFMAVKKALMRKLPGRIVGETTDVDGKRAFVLTLQAREQHIRREKATSNICSNQGLNALTATIYLTLLGSKGLKEAAERSMDSAHYLKERLAVAGFPALYEGPFFDECAVVLKGPADAYERALREADIVGGLIMDDMIPERDRPDGGRSVMLVCATEKRTKYEIDAFVRVLERAGA